MKTYEVQLQIREFIAKDTMLLSFNKPAGFSYKAGQYVSLILPQLANHEARESKRFMSLASAPHEKNLMIAMRISTSLFKQTLNSLPLKETIHISEPIGNLIWTTSKNPAVFIAGGIGIAPFRALIMEAKNKNWPQPITLFYASKTQAEAAFLSQLQTLENKNFHIIPMVTREHDWTGENGHINESMIKKYIKNTTQPIYYIVGLPEMAVEVNYTLKDMGIAPERIKTELFTGY